VDVAQLRVPAPALELPRDLKDSIVGRADCRAISTELLGEPFDAQHDLRFPNVVLNSTLRLAPLDPAALVQLTLTVLDGRRLDLVFAHARVKLNSERSETASGARFRRTSPRGVKKQPDPYAPMAVASPPARGRT